MHLLHATPAACSPHSAAVDAGLVTLGHPPFPSQRGPLLLTQFTMVALGEGGGSPVTPWDRRVLWSFGGFSSTPATLDKGIRNTECNCEKQVLFFGCWCSFYSRWLPCPGPVVRIPPPSCKTFVYPCLFAQSLNILETELTIASFPFALIVNLLITSDYKARFLLMRWDRKHLH